MFKPNKLNPMVEIIDVEEISERSPNSICLLSSLICGRDYEQYVGH